MKFISWNVNGIRAALKKDFIKSFNDLDADIFAIQETKCQSGQVNIDIKNYYQYFSYADKKGYSGTAVFSKTEPIQIIRNMWGEHDYKQDDDIKTIDNEGRLLALEFEDFWFVCVYTPNAQNELARIKPRLKWGSRFTEFCNELKNGKHGSKSKPVVMCGDFNVAHNEIDLKNPKANAGNAGFSDEERSDFTRLLKSGFVDSFRYLYPDKKDAYSWWSYRANSRARNVGWRIDYFLVNEEIANKISNSIIYPEIFGSDHCPIGLKISF